MSNKIFEGIQRQYHPYYQHPDRKGRVSHRDLPKHFIEKLTKYDDHLRIEYWNTGEHEDERGANPAWRLFRYIGPHYWSHVRWFDPHEVPSQKAVDWVHASDKFRHGPENTVDLVKEHIKFRRKQFAEEKTVREDTYSEKEGVVYDEIMTELTKSRLGSKQRLLNGISFED